MDADTWPGQQLSTSRGPVFVRHDAGSGDPDAGRGRDSVLFVHGLGGEGLDWAEVAVQLADRYACYAIDLPGFANSPLPTDDDLSLDAQVRAVAEVMATIGPLHLVGNSFGGAVAMRVAAECPDLVRSLTLISPALPDLRPRLGSAELTVVLIPVLGPAIVRAALRADPETMARRIYALCYGHPEQVTAQRHARELATLRDRSMLAHGALVYRESVRAIVRSYLERGPRRLWRQAAAVGVPTLLIFGGRDKLVACRTAVKAMHTFARPRLLLLPEVGHVAHLERAREVALALRVFLPAPPVTGPSATGMIDRHGTVVDGVRSP